MTESILTSELQIEEVPNISEGSVYNKAGLQNVALNAITGIVSRKI